MRPIVAHFLITSAVLLAVAPAETATRSVAPAAAGSVDPVFAAIRREGLERSRVMQFASSLIDGIGARLTGSSNLDRAATWARDTLSGLGIAARLEDWGEFGNVWRQENAWARMTTPDIQPLWLQAAPWSASTGGPVAGQVVLVDPATADLDRLKGTLAGKIVLLGAPTPTPQVTEALSHRYTDAELSALQKPELQAPNHTLRSGKSAVLRMLRSESILAIIEPSRQSGGSAGTGMIVDDNFVSVGLEPWTVEGTYPIPHAVMVPEHYGRLARLTQQSVPVTLQVDIDTKRSAERGRGYNVIAEIPGTDPLLAPQIVMAGAHLDSWGAGTGATDDGAGVAVGMEALRILKAAGVRPKRTIRLALWTGEEQGLYGSRGYVRDHLATFAPSDKPKPANLPEWLAPHGAVIPKSEWSAFDVYFNLDAGAGRIRGIYTDGDEAAAAVFRAWITLLADLGVSVVTTRTAQGSDQEAFQAAGLPAFAFLQDPLDYETRAHHSNLDTFERLNEADLRQAAIVEAIFLFNAAQRDAMLPRRVAPVG